jgi:threonine/homoserine/homoserine lactone efflux protein
MHLTPVFLATCLVLAVTPGPGVMFLITRTLSQGRAAGLASVSGLACGTLVNLLMASCGLAVILAASATAFMVVKFAGAAYLVFLGLKVLLAPSPAAHAAPPPLARHRRSFREGLTVGVLNPKTALFFAAFLPQFIDPTSPPLLQSLLLGCVFIAIAACTDTLYVLSTAAVGPTMLKRLRPARYGRYVSASTYIGLGLFVAFGDARKTP